MARTEDELGTIAAFHRPQPRFRRWRWAAILSGLVGAIAIAWSLRRPPSEIAGHAEPAGSVDAQGAELRQRLDQCRSLATTEGGSEPDWVSAAGACDKALDLDPIQADANLLLTRIKLERQAYEEYSAAQRALEQLRPEDALELLGRIPAGSFYHRKASLLSAEAEEMVKKRAGDDCRNHFRARRWSTALRACEKYMALACRSSDQDQWIAPRGHRLKLAGRIGRGEWRPKDDVYRTYLQLRTKLYPRAGAWRCPGSAAPSDAHREVSREFQRRFTYAAMADALTSYWSGNASEAVLMLQKVREDPRRIDLHAPADELRREIALVAHWFKAGESALQAENPERAREPFQAALQRDRKLMGDLADRWPSFFSRSIRHDMANHSYQRGRHWADRGDVRRACRIWKLGAQFYRGNAQLLQALRYCTEKGRDLVHSAQSCAELSEAVDLAVPGDGLNPKVQQKRTALRCP